MKIKCKNCNFKYKGKDKCPNCGFTKSKNPLVIFLKLIVSFYLFYNISGIIGGIFVSSIDYKLGYEATVEFSIAIITIIWLVLIKKTSIFKSEKGSFLNGLKLGIPFLLLTSFYLVMNKENLVASSLPTIIDLGVHTLCIGIVEELICRGWFLNYFLEKYGNTDKKVIISLILSSLIFGIIHLLNILSQDTFNTIFQIIFATFGGLVFGSIYYKTKNIYSVILLHAFYDFSAMSENVLFLRDIEYGIPTQFIMIYLIIEILLISLLFIISCIYIFKKDAIKMSYKFTIFSLIMVLFTSYSIMVSLENKIDEFNNYKIIFNYKEKQVGPFTSSFIHKDDYYIGNTNDKWHIYLDGGSSMMATLNDKPHLQIGSSSKQIIVENFNNKEKYIIPFENIKYYEIIENDTNYTFIFVSNNSNGSTVYLKNIALYYIVRELIFTKNIKCAIDKTIYL